MRDRFKSVLVNPTWEQILERDPLIAFSHYLSGRVHVLLAIADEIVENLDEGFSGQPIDGGRRERAESLIWLWMLGAYEVVRTMCQAKACFTQQTLEELNPEGEGEKTMPVPEGQGPWSGTPNFKYVWLDFFTSPAQCKRTPFTSLP